MIDVTVKTLDSQNFQFSVPDTLSVIDFKRRISSSVGVEPLRQRLIFCGRVLDDEKRLNDYDVHGKVIHLVQRPPPSSTPRTPDAGASPVASRGSQTSAGGTATTTSAPSTGSQRRHHHHHRRTPANYGRFVSPGMSAGLRMHVAREMLTRMTRCLEGRSGNREQAGSDQARQDTSSVSDSESGGMNWSVDSSQETQDQQPPGRTEEIQLSVQPGVEVSITLEEIIDVGDGEPAAEVVLASFPPREPASASTSNESMDVSTSSEEGAVGGGEGQGSSMRNVTNTSAPSELADTMEALINAFEALTPRMREVVGDIRAGRWTEPANEGGEQQQAGEGTGPTTQPNNESHQRYQRLARGIHFLSHAAHAVCDVKPPTAEAEYLTAPPLWIGGAGSPAPSVPMRGTIVEGPALTVSMQFGRQSPPAGRGTAERRASSLDRAAQRRQEQGQGQEGQPQAQQQQQSQQGVPPVVSRSQDLAAQLSAMVADVVGGFAGVAAGAGGGGQQQQQARSASSGGQPATTTSSATVTVESGSPGSGQLGGTGLANSLIQTIMNAMNASVPGRGSTGSSTTASTQPAGAGSGGQPSQAAPTSGSGANQPAGGAASGGGGAAPPNSGGQGGAHRVSRGLRIPAALGIPMPGFAMPRNISQEFDPFLPCDSRHLPSQQQRRGGPANNGRYPAGFPAGLLVHGSASMPMGVRQAPVGSASAPPPSGQSAQAATTTTTASASAGAGPRPSTTPAGPSGRGTAAGSGGSRPAAAVFGGPGFMMGRIPVSMPAGMPTMPAADALLQMIAGQIIGGQGPAASVQSSFDGGLGWILSTPMFQSFQLMPDLTLADIATIWTDPSLQSVPSGLRQRIREAVTHHILAGNPPTPNGFRRGVDEFFTSFNFSEIREVDNQTGEYDVEESVRNFGRASLLEAITKLFDDSISDEAFYSWIRNRLSERVREFFFVCSNFYTDGIDGSVRLFRAQTEAALRDAMPTLPPMMAQLAGSMLDGALQSLREWMMAGAPQTGRDEWMAQLRRDYLVRVGAAAPAAGAGADQPPAPPTPSAPPAPAEQRSEETRQVEPEARREAAGRVVNAAPPAEAMDVEESEVPVVTRPVVPVAVTTSASTRPTASPARSAGDGATRRPLQERERGPPLPPVDNWEEVLPREWIEVVRDDIRRQEVHPPQRRPFSDAYLSGMGSKRRRLATNNKAPCDSTALLRGALKSAVTSDDTAVADPITAATVVEEAVADGGVRSAFAVHLRRELQRRVADDPDFNPARFRNLSTFLERGGPGEETDGAP